MTPNPPTNNTMAGWFISEDCTGIAEDTFRRMMQIISHGGQVDVVARVDGKDYRWQCDGLKYAKRIESYKQETPKMPNAISPGKYRPHPETTLEMRIHNALHRLNLERRDIKELPDGSTISRNITDDRIMAALLGDLLLYIRHTKETLNYLHIQETCKDNMGEAPSGGSRVESSEKAENNSAEVGSLKIPATDQPPSPASTLLDPDMPAEEMRLCMGELNTQEVQLVRAAIKWANSYAMFPRRDTASTTIIKALANAAEILANFKGEPETSKLEQWQACYAMLFRQMNELVQSRKMVSLEKCAIAAGEVLQDSFSNKARPIMDVAKAVLAAAGVDYVN